MDMFAEANLHHRLVCQSVSVFPADDWIVDHTVVVFQEIGRLGIAHSCFQMCVCVCILAVCTT